MTEIEGDIFDHTDADVWCVTTNGELNVRGEAIMGRGIALNFAKRYPQLPVELGDYIRTLGNKPFWFTFDEGPIIVTFPTKHLWKSRSSLDLIEESARELLLVLAEIDFYVTPVRKVVLPKPGCTNGGLSWENDVKPLLLKIMGNDPRIVFIEKAGNNDSSGVLGEEVE